jgi:hypothetical protein
VLQAASATWLVADFETPNVSTAVARTLVSSGEYAVPAHLLPIQFDNDRRFMPIRAYVLPGEPLLLALAFRLLPVPLHRYIHVPVTIAFVVAIAAVARAAAGGTAAIAAGAIASLDPFVLQHGPVWDDALLAAALQWSFIAIVVHRVSQADERPFRPALAIAGGLVVFGAALTRMQSQVELVIIGIVLATAAPLRRVRALGLAAILGIGLALAGWGTRNALVLDTLLLGTSHDGVTLWQSNHLRARESILQTGVTQTLAPAIRDPGGDEIAIADGLRREAIEYLRRNPGDAVVTSALKIVVSVVGVDFGARRAGRNVIAASASLVLFGLAVAGWRRWRNNQPSVPLARVLAWCVGVIGGVTMIMLAFGPVGIRYRMTATGLAYVFAGLFVAAIAGRRSARAPIATL